MPVALIPKFAELCAATKGRYEKVALVTDIREKNGIKDIFNALETLREMDSAIRSCSWRQSRRSS